MNFLDSQLTINDLIYQLECKLNVPVHHVVCVKVIIILSPGVYESFCHLEPANIEDELERSIYGKVVVFLFMKWVNELLANNTWQEEGIDSESNNLENYFKNISIKLKKGDVPEYKQEGNMLKYNWKPLCI